MLRTDDPMKKSTTKKNEKTPREDLGGLGRVNNPGEKEGRKKRTPERQGKGLPEVTSVWRGEKMRGTREVGGRAHI